MAEQKYQNAPMEFTPLSFAGNTNNESNYMHFSSQQAPQNYVEFLSQSGLSEIQNQMPLFNNGVAVNNFTCLVNNQEQVSNVAGLPSRMRSDVTKQKAREADRRRRSAISARLDALQELIPHSNEGGKPSVLDDAIDYIKYLQMQVKELSRSRLEGEPISSPLIFLEGYGHYLLQENLLNESLEEKIGKLLLENPSAAIQLLQSKGLYVMPMALAEGLFHGI